MSPRRENGRCVALFVKINKPRFKSKSILYQQAAINIIAVFLQVDEYKESHVSITQKNCLSQTTK